MHGPGAPARASRGAGSRLARGRSPSSRAPDGFARGRFGAAAFGAAVRFVAGFGRVRAGRFGRASRIGSATLRPAFCTAYPVSWAK